MVLATSPSRLRAYHAAPVRTPVGVRCYWPGTTAASPKLTSRIAFGVTGPVKVSLPIMGLVGLVGLVLALALSFGPDSTTPPSQRYLQCPRSRTGKQSPFYS